MESVDVLIKGKIMKSEGKKKSYKICLRCV